MEAVVMKQLSIVFTVWWLSVMSGNALGHELPDNSDVQLKSDGNIVELYKGSGNGSSWLQMVLVFSHHSSNNQPTIVIEDAPRNNSEKDTTEAPIVCQEGFVQLESKKCYFFSTKTETWHDALKSCQAMGTTLAYPLNESENSVLVNHIIQNFQEIYSWGLGGSDEAKEGQWVWAHSQSPIGYADWPTGQPGSAAYGHHCLDIQLFSVYGWRWNDVPCSYSYNYICQQ